MASQDKHRDPEPLEFTTQQPGMRLPSAHYREIGIGEQANPGVEGVHIRYSAVSTQNRHIPEIQC
jgi:hypothetical protein